MKKLAVFISVVCALAVLGVVFIALYSNRAPAMPFDAKITDFYVHEDVNAYFIDSNHDLYVTGKNKDIGTDRLILGNHPVKIFENVASAGFQSLVTTSGDLYCWGDMAGLISEGKTSSVPLKAMSGIREFRAKSPSVFAFVDTAGKLKISDKSSEKPNLAGAIELMDGVERICFLSDGTENIMAFIAAGKQLYTFDFDKDTEPVPAAQDAVDAQLYIGSVYFTDSQGTLRMVKDGAPVKLLENINAFTFVNRQLVVYEKGQIVYYEVKVNAEITGVSAFTPLTEVTRLFSNQHVFLYMGADQKLYCYGKSRLNDGMDRWILFNDSRENIDVQLDEPAVIPG